MSLKVSYIFAVLVWAYFFTVVAGGVCRINGVVGDCGTSGCCLVNSHFGCCDGRPMIINQTTPSAQDQTPRSYTNYSSTTTYTSFTLSIWAIIGIVAGVVVIIAIITSIVILVRRKHRIQNQIAAQQNQPENGAYQNSAYDQNGAMNTSGMKPGVMYPPNQQPQSGQVNAGYAPHNNRPQPPPNY